MGEKKYSTKRNIKKRFLLFGALAVLLVILVLSIKSGSDSSTTPKGVGSDSTLPSVEVTGSFKAFNDCLAESGMVIYGSKFCSTCNSFIEELGGYEAVTSVYVECTDYPERCNTEMQTEYVPEIQLHGEVYTGQRSLTALADVTDCLLQE